MNVIGSGRPRKVPNARRMMRSASERSPSLKGRSETSGFTSTIGVLLSSTQPHQAASQMQLLTQKCGQDKACKVRQPQKSYENNKRVRCPPVRGRLSLFALLPCHPFETAKPQM